MLQHRNALFADLWPGAGKICKICGVHREWTKAVLLHSCAEFRELFRQLCATCPAGWITSKDLQPHSANGGGSISRLDEARSNSKVRAQHAI
jgi:hypothetical protein